MPLPISSFTPPFCICRAIDFCRLWGDMVQAALFSVYRLGYDNARINPAGNVQQVSIDIYWQIVEASIRAKDAKRAEATMADAITLFKANIS